MTVIRHVYFGLCDCTCRYQAFALKTPVPGSMGAIAILRATNDQLSASADISDVYLQPRAR
jgi:hypothetical protein